MTWLRARFFGVTFLLLGLMLGLYAATQGGYFYWLLWPAVSLVAAGLAYLWLGPALFGKTPKGTRRLASRVLLMPYCGANWFGWRLLRFVVKEDVWNEAAPKLYIGRRAYDHELPADVGLIVDLTAEFIEPAAVRTKRAYRSFPILDAHVPRRDEEVLALAQELATVDDAVYIHCAEGHGRAAMIVALVLVARGAASDAQSALAHIKTVRPKTNLRPHQRAALERWIRMLPPREPPAQTGESGRSMSSTPPASAHDG
jgi:protein-tyrosine phosphatase